MRSELFEIIETSGPRAGDVVGYLQLCGAEPIYLPVKLKQVLDAGGNAGWMGLEAFRGHLDRTLEDLRVRRISRDPAGA